MKNARKIKKRCGIAVAAVGCVSLACAAVAFLPMNEASATKATAERVRIGDELQASEYELTYNGQNVSAEGVIVVHPDGSVYEDSVFAVKEAGKYEVTYYATVNGERVEETLNYLAVRTAKELIVAEDAASVTLGKYEVESPYELQQDTYGGIVTFKAGQSIEFATNIKTAKLTKEYNIVDLIVMPSAFKETDFERLTIRIADSQDENNFVEVIINSSNPIDGWGQVSYVRAGANGQQAGGYENASYHTEAYGTQIEHSFRGLGHKGEDPYAYTVAEKSLTISLDHESKRVFCGPAWNSTEKLMVNDLDDVAHYKSNPWGGFTSDEVTVKITADNFSKSSGKVLFKSFGDYDMSKDVVDETAPEITLSYGENETLPVAVANTEFDVLPYSVRDNFDKDVKTNVYVYYLGQYGERIDVECDGDSFFVKRLGEYEIEYCAEDYSGNVTTKSLKIKTAEQPPQIFISIENEVIEAEAYQTVALKLANEMQVFGGSGRLSVERTVYSPSKQVVDAKGELFLAELGDYKVIYKVTDELGTVQYGVVTVRSTPTAKPLFVETPKFDKVLVAGFTYELPKANVIEASNGEIRVPSYSVYVNDAAADGKFTATGDSVTIRYVAVGETGESVWTTTIPVVNTEYGKYQSKYFHSENGVVVVDEKDFVTAQFSQDSSVEFIKALYSQEFSFALSYAQENVNFDSLAITMTDAADESLSVTLRLYFDRYSNQWFIQAFDGGEKLAYSTSKNILSFSRSADGLQIVDTSGAGVLSVKRYDNGETFKGFSSFINIRWTFEGVKGASSVNFTQLCNQPMGYKASTIDKAMDEIQPVIMLDEEFIVCQKLGEKAIIPTATACDVLGQVSTFTVMVEKVGGGVLVNASATEKIDFVLAEAGNYLVTYYAEDNVGNSTMLSRVLFVSDETAPVLTVKGSLKSEYKAGSKISIPTYSATDNGANCYIQVTLIMPNNEMRLLHYTENGVLTSLLSVDNDLYPNSFKADDNSFIATQKGEYVLRFLAYDEYYNTVEKEFRFIVK